MFWAWLFPLFRALSFLCRLLPGFAFKNFKDIVPLLIFLALHGMVLDFVQVSLPFKLYPNSETFVHNYYYVF